MSFYNKNESSNEMFYLVFQDEQNNLLSELTINRMAFSGSPVIFLPDRWKAFMPSRLESFIFLCKIDKLNGSLFYLPHGKLSQKFKTNHYTLVNPKGKHFKLVINYSNNKDVTEPFIRNFTGNQVLSDAFNNIILRWANIFDYITDKNPNNFDSALNRFEIEWREIQLWLDELKSNYKEQYKSIIVEISKIFSSKIAHLVNQMRRILQRERIMVPLNRVQETDSTCVKWFSQQAGNTIIEKAGIKQKILAVSRFESQDTLENRVFKDFIIKCIKESFIFLNNDKEKINANYNSIKKFKEICQSIIKESLFKSIGSPTQGFKPNYVLQKDIRYQKMWKYYQKLLRKELAEEKIWDWQSVMWTELSVLLTCTALNYSCYEGKAKPENGLILKPISQSKVKISKEIINGRKIDPESLPGPFLATQYKNNKPQKYCVIELVHSTLINKHSNPIIKELGILGPQLIIQITPMNCNTNKSKYVIVWAINGAGLNKLHNIEDIQTSVYNSIEELKRQLFKNNSLDLDIKGIVFLSHQNHEVVINNKHRLKNNVKLIEICSIPNFCGIRDFWFETYFFTAETIRDTIEEMLHG